MQVASGPSGGLACGAMQDLGRTGARSSIGHLRRLLGLAFGLAVIVRQHDRRRHPAHTGSRREPLQSPERHPDRLDDRRPLHVARAVCLVRARHDDAAGPAGITSMPGAASATGSASGVGWTDWLTYCTVLAYVSIGLAEFAGVFIAGAHELGADNRDRRPPRDGGAPVAGPEGERSVPRMDDPR